MGPLLASSWAPCSALIRMHARSQSFLDALNHVQARATIKADLKVYRFYDNVRGGECGWVGGRMHRRMSTS
jgi:hypothetical protein